MKPCVRLALFVSLLLVAFGCSRPDGPSVTPVSEPPPGSPAGDPAPAPATEASQGASEPAEKPPPGARREVAVLAGGCFWGMEELLRKQPGVIDTTVGYAGGRLADPRYEDVKTGRTGHAEAVRIVFDPEQTSYEALLLYFFKIHDPTTEDRQGNDVGSQYRSAIFAGNAEQRRAAEGVKARVEAAGVWDGPITTEITEGATFTPAEDYHQDYLQRIPGGYTCHYERDFSI